MNKDKKKGKEKNKTYPNDVWVWTQRCLVPGFCGVIFISVVKSCVPFTGVSTGLSVSISGSTFPNLTDGLQELNINTY